MIIRRVRAADALTHPSQTHGVCRQCGKRGLLSLGACLNGPKCNARLAKKIARGDKHTIKSKEVPDGAR